MSMWVRLQRQWESKLPRSISITTWSAIHLYIWNIFYFGILGIEFGIVSLKTKNVKHGLDMAGLVLSTVAVIKFETLCLLCRLSHVIISSWQ